MVPAIVLRFHHADLGQGFERGEGIAPLLSGAVYHSTTKGSHSCAWPQSSEGCCSHRGIRSPLAVRCLGFIQPRTSWSPWLRKVVGTVLALLPSCTVCFPARQLCRCPGACFPLCEDFARDVYWVCFQQVNIVRAFIHLCLTQT